ncbi:MAG: DUF2007 domain-containing protein [Pedobacter sp.]|nr:MAG: DUF2007 domain-containing protein [Pedobacter sp.]
MERHVEKTFVTVFSGEVWKATMIRNVLEDHNIFAQLKNELMASIEPWAVTAAGFNPAEVLVPNDDYERAIELLHEFENATPQSE